MIVVNVSAEALTQQRFGESLSRISRPQGLRLPLIPQHQSLRVGVEAHMHAYAKDTGTLSGTG
jgi:hypothetical protein